ncbi:MAG TPA: hypothetical protein VG674_28545 [Amycolatopsis sp.]|nr:hypothetical protein [Amycolatopsis sp.]
MSRPMSAQDAWKTPEMREAESALDRAVSQSRNLLKNLDKLKLKPLPKTDTPERIEALKRAAAKPDAPAELRLVKQKVDSGKMKWEDVASGRAFADPDVRALADAKLGEAKDMYEELEEGLSPEEVFEAREGARNDLAGGGRSAYPVPEEQPKEFSNEDPLASSTSDSYAKPAATEEAPPSRSTEEDFADPLHHQGPYPSTPPSPEPPAADPEPPAPDHGRHSTPRHSAPRHEAPPADDDEFTNPLAERNPRSKPAPPPSAPRRRADPPPDDDDYFGGSFLG